MTDCLNCNCGRWDDNPDEYELDDTQEIPVVGDDYPPEVPS